MEVFGGLQGGGGQVQGNGVFVGGVGEDDGGRWGSERGHPNCDVCLDVEILRSTVVFFLGMSDCGVGGKCLDGWGSGLNVVSRR